MTRIRSATVQSKTGAVIRADEAVSEPFGIDTKLIECLEAFERWMEAQLWLYDYDSAKAAWIDAWFYGRERA